jgi:hypothetical protein
MADETGNPIASDDSTDVMIRQRLDRAVLPADPAGAYERVVEKRAARRVRRRAGTVVLALAVVAGTVTGSIALIKVFGGPSTSPRPVRSVPTPTVTAPASQSPPPSQSPPMNACLNSSLSADFDGNGSKDSVFVHPVSCTPETGETSALWSINFSWGPGHEHHTVALPQCATAFCGAAGSIPMNDGTTALILRTDQTASSTSASYVLLNLSPGRGPRTYAVTGAGGEGFPAGRPAVLVDGSDTSSLAFLGCRGGPFPGGGDMATIVQTIATLAPGQTTYRIVQTELAHGPNAGRPELIVVSQQTRNVAAGAFDPNSISVGAPCVGP